MMMSTARGTDAIVAAYHRQSILLRVLWSGARPRAPGRFGGRGRPPLHFQKREVKTMRIARVFVALSTLVFAVHAFGVCRAMGPEANVPRPSSVPPEKLGEYEVQLLKWLQTGSYTKWCGDKAIRDTGPFLNDIYYGTHKAARVYYSP